MIFDASVVSEGTTVLDCVERAAALVPLPALETATPIVWDDCTENHVAAWVVTAQEFVWHLSYYCVWKAAPDVFENAYSVFPVHGMQSARLRDLRVKYGFHATVMGPDITEETVSNLADMTMEATRRLASTVLARVKNAMTASRFSLLLTLGANWWSSLKVSWGLRTKLNALEDLLQTSREHVCLAPWWNLDPMSDPMSKSMARPVTDGVQGCLKGARPCPFAVDWTRSSSPTFSRDCYHWEFVPDLYRMPLGIAFSTVWWAMPDEREGPLPQTATTFKYAFAVHHMLEDCLLWIIHSIQHAHPWRWFNGSLYMTNFEHSTDSQDAASVTWYTLRCIGKIFRRMSRDRRYPCSCHCSMNSESKSDTDTDTDTDADTDTDTNTNREDVFGQTSPACSLRRIVASVSFIILRQVWDGPYHFAPSRLAKFVLACKDHTCLTDDPVVQWCLHECLVKTGMWACKPHLSLTSLLTIQHRNPKKSSALHRLLALTWSQCAPKAWAWEVLKCMQCGIAHLMHCVQTIHTSSYGSGYEADLVALLVQAFQAYFELTLDVAPFINLPDITCRDINGPCAHGLREAQETVRRLNQIWTPLRQGWLHTVVRVQARCKQEQE